LAKYAPQNNRLVGGWACAVGFFEYFFPNQLKSKRPRESPPFHIVFLEETFTVPPRPRQQSRAPAARPRRKRFKVGFQAQLGHGRFVPRSFPSFHEYLAPLLFRRPPPFWRTAKKLPGPCGTRRGLPESSLVFFFNKRRHPALGISSFPAFLIHQTPRRPAHTKPLHPKKLGTPGFFKAPAGQLPFQFFFFFLDWFLAKQPSRVGSPAIILQFCAPRVIPLRIDLTLHCIARQKIFPLPQKSRAAHSGWGFRIPRFSPANQIAPKGKLFSFPRFPPPIE